MCRIRVRSAIGSENKLMSRPEYEKLVLPALDTYLAGLTEEQRAELRMLSLMSKDHLADAL